MFGNTQESKRNSIISNLEASNKILQNNITLCGRQTDKHEIDIKSLKDKLNYLMQQVSDIAIDNKSITSIMIELNTRLNNIT